MSAEQRTIDDLREQVRSAGIRPSRPSSSDDHLATQIERLERAQLTMERRLQDSQLSPVQRVRLQQKCDTLGNKADKLRAAMNQRVEDARFSQHAKGSHRALAARLRSFVANAASHDEGNTENVVRVQSWLAILVRERRAALEEIQERIYQARRYILRATIQLDEVTSAEGGEAAESEVRTHVGMAEEAIRDARNDLILLAHYWTELGALARRRDWSSLPFSQLKDDIVSVAAASKKATASKEVMDAETATVSNDGPDADTANYNAPPSDAKSDVTPRLEALRDELKATAIWLQELRTAVQSAPPPFTSRPSER